MSIVTLLSDGERESSLTVAATTQQPPELPLVPHHVGGRQSDVGSPPVESSTTGGDPDVPQPGGLGGPGIYNFTKFSPIIFSF